MNDYMTTREHNDASHMSNVILQLLQTEGAHHKPQLQRAKAAAQRDLPVLRETSVNQNTAGKQRDKRILTSGT